MDAYELHEGVDLDWEQVSHILKEHFSQEDVEILLRIYGLDGHRASSKKELRSFTKLKKKELEEKITRLQNKLFQILKDKESQVLSSRD